MAAELVLNALFNPIPSFFFGVNVDGVPTDSAFQEVSGIEQEVEVEEVVSGGENRFRYRLPKGLKSTNLVLKRGVAMLPSPLSTWCQETQSGGMGAMIQPKTVLVTLFSPERLPAIIWTFTKAWPVKWAFSELKAQENALLIETIELSYQTCSSIRL